MNPRKTSLAIFCSVTVLLAMLVSVVWTIPAQADSGSGTPPPTPPTSGTGSSRKTKGSSSGSLSQVPSGTKVVVLDNNGNKVPLGSEEAQLIVNSGDPIWCPSTVAVPTNGGSCSPIQTSFSGVLSWLAANNPAKDGVIWIENTYNSNTAETDTTDPFILYGSGYVAATNSFDLSAISNYKLTLKGGWVGCTPTCVGTITTSGPNYTTFAMPIEILNWNNNVTLSDITINGATTGTGLKITTKKNIHLTRVISENNTTGGGASLDDCLWNGAKCLGNGDVTITTGTFDSNQNGDGLDITSAGVITVSNLDASSNSNADPVDTCLSNLSVTECLGAGAVLDNQHATSPKSVTVSESSNAFKFDSNFSDGLDITSFGAVALTTITANSNGTGGATYIPNGTDGNPLFGLGAYLQNSFTGATSASTVAITGSNQFNHNYYSGLSVASSAAITANNLDAEWNGGVGAALVNHPAPVGHPSINLSTSSSVLDNIFTSNAFDGLDVWSDGAIAVKNVIATGNGTDIANGGVGAWLENDFTTASSPVTLSGNNTFAGNYSLIAAIVDGGLTVLSHGAILANNITSTGDLAGTGAYFDNSVASSAQPVTLTGANLFASNAYNDGLDIFSAGAITVSNLNSIDNGASAPTSYGDGAYFDNCQFDNVTLRCTLLTSQPITLTGNTTFEANGYNGLEAYTNGTVKLSSVSANLNKQNGVYIENGTTSFRSSVILTGTDSFNNNAGDGLAMFSNGAISLNTVSLDANGNGTAGSGDGVFLDNHLGASKSVTISGVSFFDDNQDRGLTVFSNGAITASNVTANNNVSRWGVELGESGAGSITFTGTNAFDGNGHDGISISSNGAITLSNVTANDDGKAAAPNTYGVWVDNSAAANQAVTLTGTNTFNGNYTGGIYVNSKGAIKLNNITANDSVVGPGALLINDAGTSASGVTLTGYGTFNDNLVGDGLDIFSNGVVSLTKVIADYSGGNGLNIDNTISLHTYAGTPNNVTITCGSFDNNTGFGVDANLISGKTLTLIGGILIGNGGGNTPQDGSGTLINSNPVCPLQ